MAMSGGVDSSTAAAILIEQGYRVIGLTARMWPEGSRCCSDSDIDSARRIADHLGFEHHVVELHDVFQRYVVGYFVREYVHGRTPSPCALCNRHVKFGALLESAIGLGAAAMATGHYSRLVRDASNVFHLLKGVDAKKDQSYFLFDLSQDQLAKSVFPLGAMQKKQVVEYAKKLGLPVTQRPESQDLCFVDPGHHYYLIERLYPECRKEGDIVDTEGRKLGRHEGIHRFTIGQRRGLGIATGTPMYVVRIDAADNRVVVGRESEVMHKSAVVTGVRWLARESADRPVRLQAKIRYNHDAAACLASPAGAGEVAVTFDEPQFAITPGQIAAFYDGEELIGGGWIE